MSDELEKLKAELKALREQINPPPRSPSTHRRYDPTENMSMDRATMQAMIDAVPESVMRELRADARRPNPIQASQSPITSTSSALSQPQRRGTGWVPEVPLGPPPGIDLCDRMVDAQDAKDRAELIERELKIAKAQMGKGDGG